MTDRAIEAFQQETGLRLRIIQRQIVVDDYRVDAVIELPRGGGRLFAEVKMWAQQANLGALVERVKRQPGEGGLIADYVNPNMAKKLKELDVQFFDAAGNAYPFPPGEYRFPFVLAGNYRLELSNLPTGYIFPSLVPGNVIQGLPGAPYALGDGSRNDTFVVPVGPALHVDIPVDVLSRICNSSLWYSLYNCVDRIAPCLIPLNT